MTNEFESADVIEIPMSGAYVNKARISKLAGGAIGVVLGTDRISKPPEFKRSSTELDPETIEVLDRTFDTTTIEQMIETSRKWARGELDTDSFDMFDEEYRAVRRQNEGLSQPAGDISRYLQGPSQFQLLPEHIQAAIMLSDTFRLVSGSGTASSSMESIYPPEVTMRLVDRYADIIEKGMNEAADGFTFSIDRTKYSHSPSSLNVLADAIYAGDTVFEQQTGNEFSVDAREIAIRSRRLMITALADGLEQLQSKSNSA